MLAALLAVAVLARPAAALELRAEPNPAAAGDVLSVIAQGPEGPAPRLVFDGRAVPLYPVAPGRWRALVGVTAETPAGAHAAAASRPRRWFGREEARLEVVVSSRAYRAQKLTMEPARAALPAGPGARDAVARIRAVAAVDSPMQRWDGPLALPAEGRVSGGYGNPRTVNDRPWAWHKGLDVAAPVGSTVTAPAAGTVVLSGVYPVQGGTVVIDHGQGLMSALFHLGAPSVKNGERVEKGAPVAAVGGSGFSTGAHVHWGVYVHGAAVDPEPLLKRPL